jgi:hypothetical protein
MFNYIFFNDIEDIFFLKFNNENIKKLILNFKNLK